MIIASVERSEGIGPRDYPYLGDADGHIVLFNSPGSGVTLAKGNTINSVGRYREDWSERLFRILEGKVTLFNHK